MLSNGAKHLLFGFLTCPAELGGKHKALELFKLLVGTYTLYPLYESEVGYISLVFYNRCEKLDNVAHYM